MTWGANGWDGCARPKNKTLVPFFFALQSIHCCLFYSQNLYIGSQTSHSLLLPNHPAIVSASCCPYTPLTRGSSRSISRNCLFTCVRNSPSAIEGHSEKAVEAHWSPKCCCLDLFPLITGILTAPEVVGTFILRTVSAIELELTVRPGWLTPALPFPEYRSASAVSMSTWHFHFESLDVWMMLVSRPETMPAVFFSLPCFLKQGLLSLELIIWQSLVACEVPGSIPVPRVDWS